MKETAKPLTLAENPFGKIKGHTKIILTSVKDGSQKIIEHDNVFQSGVLAKFMKSFGAFNASPYGNSTFRSQPIWRNLCGGIFCFKDLIDTTNGEVEFMPAGNEMVANGAYGVTNSGTPVELGTYNSLESVTDGNASVTFVYDWGTSQGNGTINSVCLTSEIGGYIGYGNASGGKASAKSLDTNQAGNTFDGIIYKNAKWNISMDISNETITVTKIPLAITQAGILDGVAKNPETYSYAGYDVSGTGSWYNETYSCRYIGNGNVAILRWGMNTGFHSGETYNFLIFNLDSHTFTQGKAINNTGVTMLLGGARCYVSADEDYVYFGKDSGETIRIGTPLYVFNHSTGALEDTLLSDVSRVFTYDESYANGKLCDGFMRLKDYIYDKVSGEIRIANLSSTNGLLEYNDYLGAMHNFYDGNICKNPLFLATINNLAEPVVKDNTQTMKIMYTLTEV